MLTLTRAQARALDAWAINELGVPGIVLMENAAVAIEEVLLGPMQVQPDQPVLIACGPGNNGGDGLALARRLANRSWNTLCVGLLGAPGSYRGDAAINMNIASRLGLHQRPLLDALAHQPPSDLLIVDALFGTGLDRPLVGDAKAAVVCINELAADGAQVLAVDVPSGLDADTGEALGGIAVRAQATCTLAALKPGLATAQGRAYAGQVFVGDIGVPLPPAPAK